MIIAISFSFRGNDEWNRIDAPNCWTRSAHLGTAQQDVERASGASPLATRKMIHHCLLRRRHLIVFKRFEAVADELDVARIGRWRLG